MANNNNNSTLSLVPATHPNASLRERIARSRLIVDVADVSRTTLLDASEMAHFDVTREAIRLALSRTEYKMFEESRVILAAFKYRPRQAEPLFVDERGVQTFNTYDPPFWRREEFYLGVPLVPESELPSLYDEFFTHLTGGDEGSKQYLIDWIANSLRARNYTLLVAIGEQGVGKGTLGEILEGLHGTQNYYRGRDEVFKAKFNSQIARKTLFYVDEVNLDTPEAHDRLKDIVNDKVEVESKGKDALIVENYASFYLSSNKMDAIKIEPGDRRFSIIQLTDTKITEVPELFSRVQAGDYTRAENIARLGRYLIGHAIRSNMYIPYTGTARFQDVKEAGISDWEHWLLYTWATKNAGKDDGVSYTTVQSEMRDSRLFKAIPGRRRFDSLARKFPEMIAISKSKNNWKIKSMVQPEPPSPQVKKLMRGTAK